VSLWCDAGGVRNVVSLLLLESPAYVNSGFWLAWWLKVTPLSRFTRLDAVTPDIHFTSLFSEIHPLAQDMTHRIYSGEVEVLEIVHGSS
jgi:hypothetical protein